MNITFFKKSKKFILINDILNICNNFNNKLSNIKIFGVNNIKDAKNGDITFLMILNMNLILKILKLQLVLLIKNCQNILKKILYQLFLIIHY